MKNKLICWVFDVDGVITNPQQKKITQEGLIETIAQKLDKGDIITFNTGRSISWVEDRVLNLLTKVVKDDSKLSYLFVVGEKGGTWAHYQNGKLITKIDKTCILPQTLRQEFRKLINKEFSGSMFYDESKLTVISMEMIDGRDIADYTLKQLILIERIKQILNTPKFSSLKLRIDPSIIALDVQISSAGKHMGAKRIERWLKEKNSNPSRIVMIGDSQVDTEMAEELQHKYSVDFVFVGDPSKLKPEKLKNKPILTKKLYEQGTLEFLTSFNK